MAKRIDSGMSRTTEWVCALRVVSNLEKRKLYRSDDNIAAIIANGVFKAILRLPFGKRSFLSSMAPGIYEYVIARTKFIDDEFAKALHDGCEQILIFGAGFDSRAVRLGGAFPDTKIYELDAPTTQSAKIKRYKEKKIEAPENLIYIPIDFEQQALADRLEQSGFVKDKKCLFILEGLIMYLKPEAIDQTLRVIQAYAGSGSKIILDYIYASVIRGESRYYGEPGMTKRVAKVNEAWTFGVEPGSIEAFVAQYGFKVLKHLDADELERRYFTDIHGKVIGRVNGTHALVIAIK